MYIYIYIYIYIYMCVCVCVCVYIYIHIYEILSKICGSSKVKNLRKKISNLNTIGGIGFEFKRNRLTALDFLFYYLKKKNNSRNM